MLPPLPRAALLLGFAWIGLLHRAEADEVVVENGDVLHGTVRSVCAASVRLETDYAGALTIPVGKIRRLATEAEMTLYLEDGTAVRGALRLAGTDRLGVLPGNGEAGASIPLASIASCHEPPPEPNPWSGGVTAGLTLLSGNTDRQQGSLRGTLVRTRETDRFRLDLRYHYTEEEGCLTERKAEAKAKYDRNWSPKLYWFVTEEMAYDEFRDFDLRARSGLGVGYKWIEAERWRLEVEGGFAHQYQSYENDGSEHDLTLRAGLNLAWDITARLAFCNRFVAYPKLDAAGEYQLDNEAKLRYAMNDHWGFSLLHALDYDSDPPVEIRQADSKTVFGVDYKF